MVCCLSFSFMGGVAKEYITKLGCEIYFRRVIYWAALEMLLKLWDSRNFQIRITCLLLLLCIMTRYCYIQATDFCVDPTACRSKKTLQTNLQIKNLQLTHSVVSSLCLESFGLLDSNSTCVNCHFLVLRRVRVVAVGLDCGQKSCFKSFN
jgi:hypothetical protein